MLRIHVKKPRRNIWSHITQPLSSFFPVQPAYENYSFEELRYASPALQRQSETMLVRPNNDGTYSANWTPGNVGFYQIHVVVDGCEMPEPYKVEVINLFNFFDIAKLMCLYFARNQSNFCI